jgi:hypothetical protein
MSLEPLNSIAAERAVFKRLHISLFDLGAAARFTARLAGVGSFANAPALDGTTREGLQVALVISYARPFSGNRRTSDVEPTLPAAFLSQLCERHRTLHGKLLSLRDQEFAHSDPVPADVKVWVSQRGDGETHAAPVNSVSMTRAEITSDALTEIGELITALTRLCLEERNRIRRLLPVGEHF